jgi:hypothetical protein
MMNHDVHPPENGRTASVISRKELYEMIRRQIEHEDSLINQRLNWLLVSQAFLLAASTTILTRDISQQTLLKPADVPIVLSVITVVGLVLSSFSLMGIRTAQDSLKNLRETWDRSLSTEPKRHALDEGFPQITWVGKGFKAITTAKGTPVLTIVIWLMLAFVSAPHSSIGWPVAVAEAVLAALVLWAAFRS